MQRTNTLKKNKYLREYRKRNSDKIRAYNKEYKTKNAQSLKAKHLIFATKNIEHLRAIRKKYKLTHKKERKQYRSMKYKLDLLYRLKTNMSSRVGKYLKRSGYSKDNRKINELVGYSNKQLKEHLEKQFSPEMSWSNYGKYWHIDHKIPLSYANSESEIINLFALDNLQPLKAEVNIEKSNIIIADLFNLELEAEVKE